MVPYSVDGIIWLDVARSLPSKMEVKSKVEVLYRTLRYVPYLT